MTRRYRDAMNETDFSDTQWLRQFPRESCDITSKLFAAFLFESGIRNITIISGNRPDVSDENTNGWK